MGYRELVQRNRKRAEATWMVFEAASEVVYAEDALKEREAIQKLKAALDEADRLGIVYNKGDRPS